MKTENRCDAELPEGPRGADPRCNNPGTMLFTQPSIFSGESNTILLCDAHARLLSHKGEMVTRHSLAPRRNEDGSIKRKVVK